MCLDVLLSRLSGAWVQAMFMFLFGKVFERSDKGPGSGPPQCAVCAQKLVLASVLMPVLPSNITAEPGTADASLGRGAVCSSHVGVDVSRFLYS